MSFQINFLIFSSFEKKKKGKKRSGKNGIDKKIHFLDKNYISMTINDG